MRWIPWFLAAQMALGAAAAGLAPFAAWEGVYERESESGRRSRERWWRDGSLLRGESSTLGPDGQWVADEQLLLVEIGTDVYYVALPRQNAYPTAFELISQQDGEAIFENREHDYPKRIGYRVDAEGLQAWIAGEDERRIEFRFRRVE